MNNFERLPLDPARRLRALQRACGQPAKPARFTRCPPALARGLDRKTASQTMAVAKDKGIVK